MNAKLMWNGNMKFTSDNHGIISVMDAAREHGGEDAGPNPKELVLNAMMGCTAMDVMAILKKMRQEVSEFKMEVEAEQTTEHPIHFNSAVLIYLFKGALDPAKIIKAVDVSLTKYCGVNYMLSKTCQISFRIVLNDQIIKTGSAQFL